MSHRHVGSQRQFSAILSMEDEFPNIPATTPTHVNASSSHTTVLSSSGLTVVTEDAASTSTVTLTFPTAGSSAESPSHETGAALVNRCLAFKSGSGLSSALLWRTLETDGATPFATAGRTSASLGFTVAPEKAARLVPLLATDCSFEKWDMKEALALAKTMVEDSQSNAQLVLTEQLYAAAFGPQSPLGQPFYTPTVATATAIQGFRRRRYDLGTAVLAATGVKDHDAFCRAVEEGLSSSSSPPQEEEDAVSTNFMGGESRLSAPNSGFAHLAVALPLSSNGNSSAMGHVLKHCLALACNDSSTTDAAMSPFYSSHGLLGVYASSATPSTLADHITTVLTTHLTEDVVTRAKRLARAEHLFSLDNGSSRTLSQSMTESVLETGGFDARAVASSYEDLTYEQIQASMGEALSSNPAVAAVGELQQVPYQPELKEKLK